jgi:hypothetical protein
MAVITRYIMFVIPTYQVSDLAVYFTVLVIKYHFAVVILKLWDIKRDKRTRL